MTSHCAINCSRERIPATQPDSWVSETLKYSPYPLRYRCWREHRHLSDRNGVGGSADGARSPCESRRSHRGAVSPSRILPPALAGQALRHWHGGGQTDEQQIETAVEFGRTVVGAQRCGQRTHLGELGDREPVQPEAQHIIGLLGPLDHLL